MALKDAVVEGERVEAVQAEEVGEGEPVAVAAGTEGVGATVRLAVSEGLMEEEEGGAVQVEGLLEAEGEARVAA